MPRQRTGAIIERKDRLGLWARLSWTDPNGRVRVIQRKVETRTEGRQLLKRLVHDLEEHSESLLDAEKLTFRKLAERYEEQELIPAVYRGQEKVAGKRDYQNQKRILKRLIEYFGSRRVRSITYTDLDRFRLERLHTLTHKKTERSSADVNRSLTLLRSVLNFAKSSGWITENPFKQGHNPLIRTSTEDKRERVVTFDEEGRLLAACTGQRAHVRPLLLFALDTAARRSEMLRLQWKDVDLVAGTATLRSYKGRVHTARSVGLTPRVKAELERLKAVSPESLVFGIKDNFFNAWDSVRDEAKLKDVRLHDLRHTAISRWILSGVQPTIAMALSGHTVFATFKRYVNANIQTAIASAEALANYQQSQIKEELITETVN